MSQILMAAQSTPQVQSKELPTVLLHRLPSFNFPLAARLRRHFLVFDPLLASPELTRSSLGAIRALICLDLAPITSETLAGLPSLELVVGTSVGLEHVDLAECRRRGISVTNAGSAFSEDVADCAVGLLIDVLRRVSACDRYVRAASWHQKGNYPLGFKLGGKRVGILGLGIIGSKVARRLVAFGCSVAYNSRTKKSSVPFPYYRNVRDLAAESDVLIVCCALNDETRNVVNEEVMMALGRGGVIINVGRGALVDEKKMVQFLVEGNLGGAGLDVFEDEPNVPKELYKLDNVVLSPHNAVSTPESFEAIQDLVLANLKAFFSNEPLVSPFKND